MATADSSLQIFNNFASFGSKNYYLNAKREMEAVKSQKA